MLPVARVRQDAVPLPHQDGAPLLLDAVLLPLLARVPHPAMMMVVMIAAAHSLLTTLNSMARLSLVVAILVDMVVDMLIPTMGDLYYKLKFEFMIGNDKSK